MFIVQYSMFIEKQVFIYKTVKILIVGSTVPSPQIIVEAMNLKSKKKLIESKSLQFT